MNTFTMIEQLGMRLEDPDKQDYTEAFRLQCLNNAQDRIAKKLNWKYLTELEYPQEGIAVTNGVTAALSGGILTYRLLGGENGVIRVRDGISNIWMIDIGIENVNNNSSYYLQGTLANPMYYVYGNMLYTLPSTGITEVDIFYLKVPSRLYSSFTVTTGASKTQFASTSTGLSTADNYYNGCYVYNATQDVYYYVWDYTGSTGTFFINDCRVDVASSDIFYILNNPFDQSGLATTSAVLGVTSEINPAFHELIVTLAEAECWARGGETQRRDAALEYVNAQIKYYNEIARVEEGIGTANENK
jgi:hypothetical protein